MSDHYTVQDLSCVRLRGLPYSATHKEICEFIGSDVNVLGVLITLSLDGRPNGHGYALLATEDDKMTAMDKHLNSMGKRYIEVFNTSKDETEYVIHQLEKQSMLKPMNAESVVSTCMRLRGLPYSATVKDIFDFFGPDIKILGAVISHTSTGSPSGEGYALLATEDDKKAALEKHLSPMGKRYIEVFIATEVETDQVTRQLKRQADVSEQRAVCIRGLPFDCEDDDLKEFFKNLKVEKIVFGKENKEGDEPTKEAFVRFESCVDAERALTLDRQYMYSSYLEIRAAKSEKVEDLKVSDSHVQARKRRLRPFVEVREEPSPPWKRKPRFYHSMYY